MAGDGTRRRLRVGTHQIWLRPLRMLQVRIGRHRSARSALRAARRRAAMPRGALPKWLRLVERNLLTGAEPLRILLAPWTHVRISPRETLPAYAAVQEDGTAVYAIAAGSRTALWTASPAQPLPRLVTTSSAGFGWLADLPLALALRDGRVAFPDAEAQEYGPRRIVIATLSR